MGQSQAQTKGYFPCGLIQQPSRPTAAILPANLASTTIKQIPKKISYNYKSLRRLLKLFQNYLKSGAHQKNQTTAMATKEKASSQMPILHPLNISATALIRSA